MYMDEDYIRRNHVHAIPSEGCSHNIDISSYPFNVSEEGVVHFGAMSEMPREVETDIEKLSDKNCIIELVEKMIDERTKKLIDRLSKALMEEGFASNKRSTKGIEITLDKFSVEQSLNDLLAKWSDYTVEKKKEIAINFAGCKNAEELQILLDKLV